MPSLALFLVASLIVVGLGLSAWDWYHAWRGHDRRVSKLAPMYLIIGAVLVVMMHVNGVPTLGLVSLGLWWYLAGVVASIIGDAFLLPPTQFVPGLAAFLVAHVCLSVYFWHHAAWLPPGVIGLTGTLVAAVVFAIVPGLTFVRHVPRREFVPVLCYLLAIAFMVVTAVNTANPLIIAGAALFALSDYLLARERYVPDSRVTSVHVMTTYHVAQWCFLLATALRVGILS